MDHSPGQSATGTLFAVAGGVVGYFVGVFLSFWLEPGSGNAPAFYVCMFMPLCAVVGYWIGIRTFAFIARRKRDN